MSSSLSIEVPAFDPGQYDECELLMGNGSAKLTLHVAELPPIVLEFRRVRWHRFTSIYACEAEWLVGSYFRVAQVKDSAILSAFLIADRASVKPYKELHHFRIVLDETGCHEFLAESASAL